MKSAKQVMESNHQKKGHRKSQPDFFSLTAWSEQDSNLHVQCADLLCHLLKESSLVMPKSLRVNLFATAPIFQRFSFTTVSWAIVRSSTF